MNAPVMRSARLLTAAAGLTVLPQLAGCAATMKLVRYGDLELKTEVSETVFLEPGARPGPVWVELRNSSEISTHLQDQVISLLLAAGYTIASSPEEASYLLQGNILQVTMRLLDEGETVQDAMLGAAVAGSVAGAVTDWVFNAGGIADEVMIVGGLVGFLADAKTKRPAYTMLTDVRVTEIVTPSRGQPRRNVHQVRVVSGATKVNLELEDALPGMMSGVAQAIAGIFPAGKAPQARVAG